MKPIYTMATIWALIAIGLAFIVPSETPQKGYNAHYNAHYNAIEQRLGE